MTAGGKVKTGLLTALIAGLTSLAACGASPEQERGPFPAVDISRGGPSTIKLSWTAQPGRVFSIQHSDELSSWKTVGLGSVDSWTDDVANVARRFYRVHSNAPPELASIGNKKVSPGETLRFTVSASDPDGDELKLGASNLPEGAAFDPRSGSFGWTPSQNQHGNYASVRFTVSDDGCPELSDYEDITIIVGKVPPEVIVFWPRELEVLEAGTIYTIEWASKGDVGEIVHIDFTPDGGDTWYVVREYAPNVGYYNWLVPDSWMVPELPSDDCWIAIWSEDESVYGLSDGPFSIYDPSYEIWAVYLVAADGQYLGDCTTDPYVWDSIWNEFGPYGGIWSWTSIWDPSSIYGSDYSDLSPWDPCALDPPYIFVNDEPVASLTTNYLIWDAIDPWDFFDWVERIGY